MKKVKRIRGPKILNEPWTKLLNVKGLAVHLRFWPIHYGAYNANTAKSHIFGWAYNQLNGEKAAFNSAGKLLCVLERWQLMQYKKHVKEKGYKKRLAA